MNIGFGKIGKVLSFNENRWSTSGGDYEPIVFIINLAISNPLNNYFIISRNNGYKENSISNLYNLWELHEKGVDDLDFLNTIIPDLDLDFIYVFGGPSSRANIPGVLWRKDGTAKRKIMLMLENYAAPILHTLNITDVPYCFIATDIRHTVLKAEDLFNYPNFCFGQGEYKSDWKHIMNYDDLETVTEEVNFKYFPFETMRLCVEKPFELVKRELNSKCVVLLNQGSHDYDTRLNYILDLRDSEIDCDVYGTWKTIKEDVDFIKDPVKPKDINETLSKYNFGLVYPLVEKQDWVTPKFYELLHNSVIPFVHTDYDIHNRLELDEFYKFSNLLELKLKIDIIINNDIYDVALENLVDQYLLPEYYNGIKINEFNNKIMELWHKV